MSSEELRVSEPMLFLFLYRSPHSATPFPPSQCARPSSAQISALSGSPFFKPCDHVGKSTSVASGAWVIFFFVVTTQHRSAWRQQGRYLSSLSLPLLSLITPRFHFNDFLVALGGPVNHPSVGRVEFASKQSHFISLVFRYNCFKHRCY